MHEKHIHIKLHVKYGLPGDEHKMFEIVEGAKNWNKTLISKVHFVG